MKKRVLLVVAISAGIFTTSTVNAQDFKPEAGAKNIEVNFSPLGNGPIDINSIRLRYFLEPDFALRLGIHIEGSSVDDAEGITDAAINYENLFGSAVTNYESSSFEFGIDLGFEKHWAGTDRLSPYWGVEIGFASFSQSENLDVDNGGGGTFDFEVTSGAIAFGGNVLIGTDFYFARKFYLGTEIGFGLVVASAGDTEFTSFGNTTKVEGPSTLDFGENINSAIRVGFIF